MKITAVKNIVTAEYHEPSTNANTSTLADLDHTTIYMDGMKVKDVPASSPAGGALMTETFDSGVASGAEQDIVVYVTASDGSGNESLPSPTLTVRVDMLAPSAPF